MTTEGSSLVDTWSAEPGALVGSHTYTSDDHPGWKVYDTGRGSTVTIYYASITITTAKDADSAIRWIETHQHPPVEASPDPEPVLTSSQMEALGSLLGVFDDARDDLEQ